MEYDNLPPVTLMESLEELQNIQNKVGIVLGLPMGRPIVRREWAVAMQAISWPANLSVMQSVVADTAADIARELICEQALIVDAPYVWFVDDDTVPPPDSLRKLLYALDQDPEAAAIGGIYCFKEEPTAPVVFKSCNEGVYWDWKVGDVFKAWVVGTGCMLIRTAALKELPKPWFKTVDIVPKDAERPGVVPISRLYVSEDVYFCDKLHKAGYKVLAHGGVLCSHWDMNTGKVYTLPEDSRPFQKTEQ